jgi:hypothetical protein
MEQKPPYIEKRIHARYRAKNGAFAVFPVELKLGQIEDISRSGLSFYYIPLDEPACEQDELEIYFADDDFHLIKIPVSVISDISMDEDLPFNYVERRRFGIKFRKLTVFQQVQLDYFLDNYTEDRQEKR